MKFFEILNGINRANRPKVLFCLLNRIPVILFSHLNEKNSLSLIKEFANIIYFRDIVVLNKELKTNDELVQLISAEKLEDLSNRYTIAGYLDDINQLQEFEDLSSFIIATEANGIGYEELINVIPSPFLSIYVNTKSIDVNYHGLNFKEIDLSFESNILHKIENETKKPLDDITYLLKAQLDIFKISEGTELWQQTLDIQEMRETIKTTILQTELQKFISASEKVYMLLRKVNQFEQIDENLEIKLEADDIIEPIKFHEATMSRIISFVEVNWRNTYSQYIY